MDLSQDRLRDDDGDGGGGDDDDDDDDTFQSITKSLPVFLHYCLARVKCTFYQKHL